MVDDDKAVFERCPAFNIECQYVTEVDRLSAENERLREAMRDAIEEIKVGAPLIGSDILSAALGKAK